MPKLRINDPSGGTFVIEYEGSPPSQEEINEAISGRLKAEGKINKASDYKPPTRGVPFRNPGDKRPVPKTDPNPLVSMPRAALSPVAGVMGGQRPIMPPPESDRTGKKTAAGFAKEAGKSLYGQAAGLHLTPAIVLERLTEQDRLVRQANAAAKRGEHKKADDLRMQASRVFEEVKETSAGFVPGGMYAATAIKEGPKAAGKQLKEDLYYDPFGVAADALELAGVGIGAGVAARRPRTTPTPNPLDTRSARIVSGIAPEGRAVKSVRPSKPSPAQRPRPSGMNARIGGEYVPVAPQRPQAQPAAGAVAQGVPPLLPEPQVPPVASASNRRPALPDEEAYQRTVEELGLQFEPNDAPEPAPVPTPESPVNRFTSPVEPPVAPESANPPSPPKTAQRRLIAPSGDRVDVHFEVRDASELITSNLDDFSPNPAANKELQPRDRSRAALRLQVNEIKNKLDPERLGDNPMTYDGAPIIGPDNQVEVGHGRVMGIRGAYNENPETARRYAAFVAERAAEMGVPIPEGVKNPVLVRVRDTPVPEGERRQFVERIGKSSTATVSAAERAVTDSDAMLQAGTLARVDPEAAGGVLGGANQQFRMEFLKEVTTPDEYNALLNRKGYLSEEGERRVRNAIVASAYKDPEIVSRIVDASEGGKARAIGSALVDAAPDLATAKDAARRGELQDLDITDELSRVAGMVEEARSRYAKENKETRAKYDAVDLYNLQRSTDDADPITNALFTTLARAGNETSKIRQFLREYASEWRESNAPKQGGMFDDAPAPVLADRETLLSNAYNKVFGEEGNPFTKRDNGPEPSPKPREEAKPQPQTPPPAKTPEYPESVVEAHRAYTNHPGTYLTAAETTPAQKAASTRLFRKFTKAVADAGMNVPDAISYFTKNEGKAEPTPVASASKPSTKETNTGYEADVPGYGRSRVVPRRKNAGDDSAYVVKDEQGRQLTQTVLTDDEIEFVRRFNPDYEPEPVTRDIKERAEAAAQRSSKRRKNAAGLFADDVPDITPEEMNRINNAGSGRTGGMAAEAKLVRGVKKDYEEYSSKYGKGFADRVMRGVPLTTARQRFDGIRKADTPESHASKAPKIGYIADQPEGAPIRFTKEFTPKEHALLNRAESEGLVARKLVTTRREKTGQVDLLTGKEQVREVALGFDSRYWEYTRKGDMSKYKNTDDWDAFGNHSSETKYPVGAFHALEQKGKPDAAKEVVRQESREPERTSGDERREAAETSRSDSAVRAEEGLREEGQEVKGWKKNEGSFDRDYGFVSLRIGKVGGGGWRILHKQGPNAFGSLPITARGDLNRTFDTPQEAAARADALADWMRNSGVSDVQRDVSAFDWQKPKDLSPADTPNAFAQGDPGRWGFHGYRHVLNDKDGNKWEVSKVAGSWRVTENGSPVEISGHAGFAKGFGSVHEAKRYVNDTLKKRGGRKTDSRPKTTEPPAPSSPQSESVPEDKPIRQRLQERADKLEQDAETVKGELGDLFKGGKLFSDPTGAGLAAETLARSIEYVAKKTAAAMLRGAIKFDDWRTALIASQGDGVKPHVQTIWDRAVAIAAEEKVAAWDQYVAGVRPEHFADNVNDFVQDMQEQGIIDSSKRVRVSDKIVRKNAENFGMRLEDLKNAPPWVHLPENAAFLRGALTHAGEKLKTAEQNLSANNTPTNKLELDRARAEMDMIVTMTSGLATELGRALRQYKFLHKALDYRKLEKSAAYQANFAEPIPLPSPEKIAEAQERIASASKTSGKEKKAPAPRSKPLIDVPEPAKPTIKTTPPERMSSIRAKARDFVRERTGEEQAAKLDAAIEKLRKSITTPGAGAFGGQNISDALEAISDIAGVMVKAGVSYVQWRISTESVFVEAGQDVTSLDNGTWERLWRRAGGAVDRGASQAVLDTRNTIMGEAAEPTRGASARTRQPSLDISTDPILSAWQGPQRPRQGQLPPSSLLPEDAPTGPMQGPQRAREGQLPPSSLLPEDAPVARDFEGPGEADKIRQHAAAFESTAGDLSVPEGDRVFLPGTAKAYIVNLNNNLSGKRPVLNKTVQDQITHVGGFFFEGGIKDFADWAEAMKQAIPPLNLTQLQTAWKEMRGAAKKITEEDKSAREKTIERIVKDFGDERYNKVKDKIAAIPEDDPNALKMYNDVLREARQFTFMDKAKAYQKGNLLTGISGMGLDVVSTSTYQLVHNLSIRPIAGAIEQASAKSQGRIPETYASETGAAIGQFLNPRNWSESFNELKQVFLHGYTEDVASRLDLPVFYEFSGQPGTSTRARASQVTARVFNSLPRLRAGINEFQRNMAYRMELGAAAHRIARQEGMKGKAFEERMAQIMADPPESVKERATEQAEHVTFTDKGEDDLLKAMYIARRAGKGGLAEFAFPFVRTAYNALKRGIELPGAAVQLAYNKEMRGDPIKRSQALAKTITGATIMMTVATIFDEDEITGPAPFSESERSLFYDSGKQPFAIKIGDHWVPFRSLGPAGVPVAITAAFKTKYGKSGPPGDEVQKALAAITDYTIVDQSSLQNISTFLDDIQAAQRGAYHERWFGGMVSSFVPLSALMRNISYSQQENTTDPQYWYEWVLNGLPSVKGLKEKKKTEPLPLWPPPNPLTAAGRTVSELERLPYGWGTLDPKTNRSGEPRRNIRSGGNAFSPLPAVKERGIEELNRSSLATLVTGDIAKEVIDKKRAKGESSEEKEKRIKNSLRARARGASRDALLKLARKRDIQL